MIRASAQIGIDGYLAKGQPITRLSFQPRNSVRHTPRKQEDAVLFSDSDPIGKAQIGESYSSVWIEDLLSFSRRLSLRHLAWHSIIPGAMRSLLTQSRGNSRATFCSQLGSQTRPFGICMVAQPCNQQVKPVAGIASQHSIKQKLSVMVLFHGCPAQKGSISVRIGKYISSYLPMLRE